MLISLKEYIQEAEKETITESIVGKGYAIAQNRHHTSNRSKLLSRISRIQSLARKGISEDEPVKKQDILFSLLLEFSEAFKIQAEMSRNEINVATAGILDMDNIKKLLKSKKL